MRLSMDSCATFDGFLVLAVSRTRPATSCGRPATTLPRPRVNAPGNGDRRLYVEQSSPPEQRGCRLSIECGLQITRANAASSSKSQ